MAKRNDYWGERIKLARQQEDFLTKHYISADKDLAKLYATTRNRLTKRILDTLEKIRSGKSTSISDYYNYQTYYKCLLDIEKECAKLGIKSNQIIMKKLTEFYQKSFALAEEQLRVMQESYPDKVNVDRSMNALRNAQYISPDFKQAERVVNTVWVGDGKRWSERIWGDEKVLAAQLQQILTDGTVGGATMKSMEERLVKEFHVDFSKAERIVRTEMSHLLNTARLDSYKRAGITRFMWITARNERVCPACMEKEKQGVFDLDPDGLNMPPIASHPNCACTTIPVFPWEDEAQLKIRYRPNPKKKKEEDKN